MEPKLPLIDSALKQSQPAHAGNKQTQNAPEWRLTRFGKLQVRIEAIMRTITLGLIIGAIGVAITWLTPIWGDLVVAFVAPTIACGVAGYALHKEHQLSFGWIMVLHIFFGALMLIGCFTLGMLEASNAPCAVVGLCVGIYFGSRTGFSIADHACQA